MSLGSFVCVRSCLNSPFYLSYTTTYEFMAKINLSLVQLTLGSETRLAYQPSLRAGKKWWGDVEKSDLFPSGMIPSLGMVSQTSYLSTFPRLVSCRGKNCVYHPSHHFLFVGLAPPKPPCSPGGLRLLDSPSSISLNMSLVGHVTWKCILFSELKILEVYTIFGFENPGSVYYFRD